VFSNRGGRLVLGGRDYIQQLRVRWPLQPLQKAQLQPPFGAPVDWPAIHPSQQLTSPMVVYLWNFRHCLARVLLVFIMCHRVHSLRGCQDCCPAAIVALQWTKCVNICQHAKDAPPLHLFRQEFSWTLHDSLFGLSDTECFGLICCRQARQCGCGVATLLPSLWHFSIQDVAT